jgi:hypothetical protein
MSEREALVPASADKRVNSGRQARILGLAARSRENPSDFKSHLELATARRRGGGPRQFGQTVFRSVPAYYADPIRKGRHRPPLRITEPRVRIC